MEKWRQIAMWSIRNAQNDYSMTDYSNEAIKKAVQEKLGITLMDWQINSNRSYYAKYVDEKLKQDQEKKTGIKVMDWQNPANKTKNSRSIYVDDDGYLRDSSIVKSPVKELIQGRLKVVHAIILHRTGSSNVPGTLASFKTKKDGTQFLIGKDGTIYQTASIMDETPHVGPIKSKCDTNKTCLPEEQDIMKKFNKMPVPKRKKPLSEYEKKKTYGVRYPDNQDSIGIEVVAMYDYDTKTWPKATDEQLKSIKKLVHLLQKIFGLTDGDVYGHGEIAYKTKDEGDGLYTPDTHHK